MVFQDKKAISFEVNDCEALTLARVCTERPNSFAPVLDNVSFMLTISRKLLRMISESLNSELGEMSSSNHHLFSANHHGTNSRA